MDSNQAREEIVGLVKQIQEHNYCYYVLDRPVVSDEEYDRLLRALIDLEERFPEHRLAHSPSRRIGARVSSGARTVQHVLKMLSLDNTYSIEEVSRWHERVVKLLDGVEPALAVEFKIDGVSAALIYERGVLVMGATRGDGLVGEDVTHNIRAISSVPLQLVARRFPVPELLEVRGEVYMHREDLVRLNQERERLKEEPFVNPRNAASGSLKLMDPEESSRRKLRFFAHSFGRVTGWQGQIASHRDFLEAAREWGLPVEPNSVLCPDARQLPGECVRLQGLRSSLPYDVDGVVIKVNDIALQSALGETMKSPRWAVAFKFSASQAVTRVRSLSVQVGRSGVLTPVAELEPVACGGVTISRSTLHNFDEVQRLDIAPGDLVLIERAGDVIPRVVKVLERPALERPVISPVPSDCPDCRPDFICRDEDEVAYRCMNPSCPRQLQRRLVHFSSRGGMDIDGLGESVASQLVEAGLVRSVAGIYSLTRTGLLSLRLFSDKKADNLLGAIERSKSRPLSRLLFALGIVNVGVKAASTLARRFKTMAELSRASLDELTALPEIGPVCAEALRRFFLQEETCELLRQISLAGVNLSEPDQDIPGKFSGQVFVFTGTMLRMTRAQAQALVRSLGADTSDTVSAAVTCVVAGDQAGAKLEKAQRLGLRIVNEQQFEEMTKDGT